MFWYLSFADPRKPKGQQWLGAVIVEAPNFIRAVDRAHLLGINPGGEVKGWVLSCAEFDPRFVDRLLDMDGIKALSAWYGGTGEVERV